MDFSPVELVTAGALACVVAAVTTPVGVSGAVFLLPVQLSVVGVPSPSVTPTNLVFNILSTPGALVPHARAGRLRATLTGVLLAGTLPGVCAGALIRVLVVPDGSAARTLVGALLVPLGLSLVLRRPAPPGAGRPGIALDGLRPAGLAALFVLALAVGVMGSMTGVGGGSIIAPTLLAFGLRTRDVVGPALCTTFVASVAGVLVFLGLDLAGVGAGQVGPIWSLGLVLGAGGVAGNWIGVRLHERLPEQALRRLLGLLAVTVGVRYLVPAIT